MEKVYLRVCGEKRTHYKSPTNPEYTLCGDQWVEDDDVCEMEALGDAPETARITCESCKTIVTACKRT